MPYVMKFLAPESLASTIIGKGGSVITAIRQATNTRMGITEHNQLWPGTDCRVLTAQANQEDHLSDACRQIIGKLQETAAATPGESVGQLPSELRLRTIVPRAAAGGIIGKSGATVKALREKTGAKISLSEAQGGGPQASQVVDVIGSVEAVLLIVEEVNRNTQAVAGEPWFKDWAMQSGASMGSGGHAGTPRNGRGHANMGHGQHGVAVPPPAQDPLEAYDQYEQYDQYAPHPQPQSGGPQGGTTTALAQLPAAGYGEPAMDILTRIGASMPSYVLEDPRGFAMSCVVPNRLVGGIIGRGGSGTKEVQALTGTKIGIRDIPGDSENRSLNIAGPLTNTCAAYMLMMKRYLDSEARVAGPEYSDSSGGRIEILPR